MFNISSHVYSYSIKLNKEQLGLAISAWTKRAISYPTLNNESLLEAILASIVSCIPDSDDMNSFPGIVSV